MKCETPVIIKLGKTTMAFSIILIALLLQRLLQFDNTLAKYDLFMTYYRWLHTRFNEHDAWRGFTGVGLIVLPGFALFTLLLVLFFHTFGIVLYYLVSLFVLWYYLDAKPLDKTIDGEVQASDVLSMTYQRIFAVLFWFAILGAVGVVLYTLVASLCIELASQEQLTESENSMLQAAITCEGILDWIPVRVLGITYALVGHFSVTFDSWRQNFKASIDRNRQLVSEWALLTLDQPLDEELIVNEDLRLAIDGLVSRALIVWLVGLALFAIGHLLG